MNYQNIFKRYELKYMITKHQQQELLKLMENYMIPDAYGKSTLCNLYFDTSQYLLIRRSIENKVYKEKLRVRSYGPADPNGTVYIELKKKYKKVVYKRRISASNDEAMHYLINQEQLDQKSQIVSEIEYVKTLYKDLRPSVYLSYEREAYFGKDDHDFRMTFDTNILWRDEDLDLSSEVYGEPLLKEDQVLMEIKIIDAMPLWLSHYLAENKIYRTSFSKYGLAYQTMMKEGSLVYA